MVYVHDEAQLISACRMGDSEAWASVWRRYYGLVAHIVRSSGFFQSHEVEEICQEVFINLLDALDRFEGRGTLKALLRVIAKRRVADAVRRRIRLSEVEAIDAPRDEDSAARIQPQVESEQHELAVLKALETTVARELENMPEDCRNLIKLRFGKGLKLREIAEQLERPVGSIGTQLQRCMTRLHEACLQHDSEIQNLEPLLESWGA